MSSPKIYLTVIFLIAFNFSIFSQTTNWKKYSSSMAGFSVKYPTDWTIDKKEASGRIWRVKFYSPKVRDYDVRQASVVIICSKPKGKSFNNWGGCRQKDNHLSAGYKDKVLSDRTFKIDELTIRRLETEDRYNPRHSYIYAFFSTKDRDFLISSNFPRDFGLAKYIPAFDEMLKTFKALSERKVTIYKNNKYDFAITYPNTWKSCPIPNSALNVDETELLKIVPIYRNCQGDNFIQINRLDTFSSKNKNGVYKKANEFLSSLGIDRFKDYIFFGNTIGYKLEKLDKEYIFRERYFTSNVPVTYEFLKITEKYAVNEKVFQKEAKEILATSRIFLKHQWYDK